MKKYTVSERLKQIMHEKNLRQVDILEKAQPYCEQYGVKLEKNALSQYVSGKVEPGQEKLTVLGLALNVSEAWLMGYNVSKERVNPTAYNNDGNTYEFTHLYNLLSPEQKSLVVSMIKEFLSN